MRKCRKADHKLSLHSRPRVSNCHHRNFDRLTAIIFPALHSARNMDDL